MIFVIFLGYHQCKFGYGSLNRTKQVLEQTQKAQCLKITEKVAFNIASYVYILSGQKFIKKAKNGPFWRVFEKPEVCGQTVFRMRHFESQFSIFSHDSCSFGIEKKSWSEAFDKYCLSGS